MGQGPLKDVDGGVSPWCSGMWGRIVGFPEGLHEAGVTPVPMACVAGFESPLRVLGDPGDSVLWDMGQVCRVF